MRIAGAETKECPREFQARLTRMFGVNQFGEPRFKIVWGQSQFILTGDRWRSKNGTERVEYRYDYQLDGRPGWHIMRWYPPSHFGSPEVFYSRTFDPSTGLYIMGPYPWHGRYEPMLSLNSKEMVNGKLVITYLPLSHFMIDTLIPMMLYAQTLSANEKAEIKKKNEAAVRSKEVEAIAESMAENMPTWVNAVSSASHNMRTSILERKMHQIQQVWNRLHRRGKAPVFAKGIAQSERPIVRGYKN